MTDRHEHPGTGVDDRSSDRDPVGAVVPAAARPPWLVPALAVGVAAVALVIAGVLSASMVLYAGLVGGMLLMHLGGHGAHGAHGGRTAADADMLSEPSSGTQGLGPGSSRAPDDQALKHGNGNEQDGDEPNVHGCH